MTTDRYEAVIVGGGPSGISCASLLAEYSVKTLLIDERTDLGGQLWRGPVEATMFTRFFGTPDKRIDLSKTAEQKNSSLTTASQAGVVGFFPDEHLLLVSGPEGLREVKADNLIFATGAREKVRPFRGWTLPGVMTVGAAQLLLKNHGVLAAPEMLICGTGPLLYLLGASVLKKHGRVTAIVDRSSLAEVLGAARLMRGQTAKLGQGLSALGCLLQHRTRIRHRQQLIGVEEKRGYLEATTVRRLADGSVSPSSERKVTTELVTATNGFVANIELPQLAGCNLEYAVDKGGWAVKVDADMQSSIEGMYAIGEITGIGGGDKAVVEGRLAALSILHISDRITQKQYQEQRQPLLAKHKHCLRFAAHLNRQWAIPGREWDDVDDDTIVCRCEDITMGALRGLIARGFTAAALLKKASRCGMGNCQGRTCGPLIYDILRHYAPETAAAADLLSVRIPLKPIPIGDLAEMESQVR